MHRAGFSPRRLAYLALALALAYPLATPRAQEPQPPAPAPAPAPAPLRVLSIKPLKLPWNTTRASWEQTKDLASEHGKVIPLAQIAIGLLFLKTAVSMPYDLVAAPFRQKTRSEVSFELRGRITNAEGKPGSNVKLILRCTSPYEALSRQARFNYYETGRFQGMADAEGRVVLAGKGITGLAPEFMVHLDLEGVPEGAASAGSYSINIANTPPSVSAEMPGSWRLTAEQP